MKTKLFFTIFLITLGFNSCKRNPNHINSNSFDTFCSTKPNGWTCQVYHNSFDTLPKPQGVEMPLAIIKYTDTTKTFTNNVSMDYPSLYLQVYDISKKDTLEKIIASSVIFSWCIPVFYGGNDRYYVITSPCFINKGCNTDEANSLIKPLHQALKGLFTKSDTTLVLTNGHDIKKTIFDNDGYDDVKAIINALKSGDLKVIRSLCTDAGYKDLLKIIPTHQQKENILIQIGNDLSAAAFHRGVSEEMIDYYYFDIEDRRINIGILPLKEGHKLIVFKSVNLYRD